jgi:hypothetical protein
MNLFSTLVANASLMEVVVLIAALTGLFLNAWTWRESHLDRNALRELVRRGRAPADDRRFIVLAMHMRTSVIHIVVKAVFALLALYAMYLPPRPDRPPGFTANLSYYLLCSIVLLLTLATLIARSDRLRLVSRVRRTRGTTRRQALPPSGA